MNFLAHLFLSGDNEEVITGGMLADFMKGTKLKDLPTGIIKGIELHRKIDQFTDEHPIVELTKQRLRPIFSHFSPVVADVYFDHFLAANWNNYTEVPLLTFSKIVFKKLSHHRHVMPLRLKRLLFYMRVDKVLVVYSTLGGIGIVFQRMSLRSKYKSNMELAVDELRRNYDLYYYEFCIFFSDLEVFVREELIRMDQK